MVQQPQYIKTVLCLANSRRPGGRCVAGKEVLQGKTGGWIRPVNPQNGDAISEADLQYENGKFADVLDIVEIPMARPDPQGHQTENHIIDPNFHWAKQSIATWQQIVSATDNVKGSLWPNGNSSFHGANDKVAEAVASGLASSLLLVNPTRFEVVVGSESQYGGGSRRRVRAYFDFNGTHYNFVITDPWIEDRYFPKVDGRYPLAESRICVSLAAVINGLAVKLVASVITPERLG